MSKSEKSVKVTSYYFSKQSKQEQVSIGAYKKMLVPKYNIEYTEKVEGFFEPKSKNYKDLQIVFIELENTDDDIYYVKKNYIYTGYVVDFNIVEHLKSLADKEKKPNSMDDIYKDFDADMKELDMKFEDISDMFNDKSGVFGVFDNLFGHSPSKKKKAEKKKTIEELKLELEEALSVEDYEKAAKLRDEIKLIENVSDKK